MRVGVDSYSYHRLLGEIRPGEDDPGERLAGGSLDVLAAARALELDAVSLQTCFLDPPDAVDAAALHAAAGPLELIVAWGHPAGLRFGEADGALDDLLAWIALAPALGARLVRLVVGHRDQRGLAPVARQLARSLPLVQAAADAAASAGVALAVENHVDLTAGELETLLGGVRGAPVGVCFDTANALRAGDDVVAAARLLAPRVRLVHLKDCEAADGTLSGPRSVPFGRGVIPLAAVLDELAGTQPLVCVELGHLGAGTVDERALVEDGVRWLRAHAARHAQSRCQTSS